MRNYLIRRILQFILIVFIANSLTFIIPRLVSGDPIAEHLNNQQLLNPNPEFEVWVEAYKEKFGVNQPLWQQYLNFWRNIFKGDFGYSITAFPETVWHRIMFALPWTVGLVSIATLLAFLIGTSLGALLGWPDAPEIFQYMVPVLMVIGGIPFWLFSFAVIWIFAVELQILPPAGGMDMLEILMAGSTLKAYVMNIIQHAILPVFVFILYGIGGWGLSMRANLIMTLGEDYILFAHAKGLPERRIFLRYGVRNALLPVVTGLAMAIGSIISGSTILESTFSYPGIGGVIGTAISTRDYFVISGAAFFMILSSALAMLAVDLLYPLIDPRVRYQ
ncbi:MAG: ABC transporter permease [Anaerolineae bacterium]|nr:ABC transporter permease [Anaerolineae bacterium]